MEGQRCTGDCLKCSFQQQVYCSAQRTYGLMKNQEAIVARLEVIESRLSAFNTEEPIIKLKTEAQKGSGADNREPESQIL
ncbi:MAG: hypothetical protein J5658_03685 [Prevotella sp.]|nr:hypothetical protein [Prevotella sp.]